MGLGVNQYLPQGAHRQQWHGWLNEMQMLLHTHPVNQQRLQAGKLPVNSVWLWGEGSLPTTASTNWDQVYGDGVLLEAMAQFTSTKCAPLTDFDATHGSCLVVINGCDATVRDRDVFGWLACIEEIQNRYLSPLQLQLKQQANSAVTLIPANGYQYRLDKRRLPHWWHRRRPLESFLSV